MFRIVATKGEKVIMRDYEDAYEAGKWAGYLADNCYAVTVYEQTGATTWKVFRRLRARRSS